MIDTWGVVKSKEALWVEVIKAKYFYEEYEGLSLKNSGGVSHLWRHARPVREFVMKNRFWVVGNAQKVRFR